jgi:sigma-E factor negative regulatory protein RseB
MRRLARAALLAFGLAGAAVVLAADGEARDWLRRMNQSLNSRNYDATFFHVRDGRTETLRIIHRVQGGEVLERLLSLDGSGREFLRSGTELTCYLPDQRTVLVESRIKDGPLLGNLPRFDESTAEFYDMRSVERARLMGRDVRVVSVNPRDDFRYGYRLWIDEKTAMPLKTELCDGQGRTVEQILFASLTLPAQIPDSAFQTSLALDGYRWLRHERAAGDGDDAAAGTADWSAPQLPPGFRLTSRGRQMMPGSAQPVTHLVFSDGVASVSVFVESASAGAPRLAGEAQVGSSSAFSTLIDGHPVTVVGEVPARTVRFIASQVRSSQPRAQDAAPSLNAALRNAATPTGPAPSIPLDRDRRRSGGIGGGGLGGGNGGRPENTPAIPAFAPQAPGSR